MPKPVFPQPIDQAAVKCLLILATYAACAAKKAGTDVGNFCPMWTGSLGSGRFSVSCRF